MALCRPWSSVGHDEVHSHSVNRPFRYSGKKSKSDDVMMQFEEFSNVHNSDRTSNATRSNLAYEIVEKQRSIQALL